MTIAAKLIPLLFNSFESLERLERLEKKPVQFARTTENITEIPKTWLLFLIEWAMSLISICAPRNEQSRVKVSP